MSLVVEIQEGNAVSRQKLTKPVFFVGRGKASDIRLTDETVSSRHAKVKCYRDHVVVEDLNSSNGTLVNGQQISGQTRVELGTSIQLGQGGPVLTLGANHATAADAGVAGASGEPVLAAQSSSGFPWVPILIGASGVFLVVSILVCALGGGLAFLWSTGGGGFGGNTVNRVLNNPEQLNKSIALICQGFTADNKDGDTQVVPWGTGTGFVVTPDGYIISNRHVVEDVQKFEETGKLTVEIPKTDGTKLKLPIQTYLAAANKVKNPKGQFWVVLNGREYDAKVVYVSKKFDLSILKIDGKDLPVFKVKETPEIPKATKVYALGFPGSARAELSKADKQEKIVRDIIPHESVMDCFPSDAFEFSITEGIVNKIADKTDANWILHDAVVSGGNSGGPLCDENGTVIGINTMANNIKSVYFSLTMEQLRDEIDQYIDGVKWSAK